MDESVFEEMKNYTRLIGSKMGFLDSLMIAVEEKDFWNYMELYSFPDKLKDTIEQKQIFL